MNPPLVVAITGTRGVGKDTLFSLLQKLQPSFQRYAFADLLKADMIPFLGEQFGIDPTTATGAAKELIRPLLIAYGCAKRETDIDYWVRRTVAQIQTDWHGKASYFIPLITDCRFVNEAKFLRKVYGSSLRLINVTREGAPPPTDEEEKHFRLVAAMADEHIHWGHNTPEEQEKTAQDLLQSLLKRP